MKKYLPSKKFIYALSTIILIGLILFAISNFFVRKEEYSSKKDTLSVGKLTLNDLLQKDSDGDGVMDWEETLWSTDPNKQNTFNNIPDAEYIKKKRAELKIDENTTTNGQLTETDKFAQEFFASFLAMKQNGQIDQNTIKNVSNVLGQQITDPTLTNKYSESDIKINSIDNNSTRKIYYSKAKEIFNKYKKNGLGDELVIVEEIAASEKIDPESIQKLKQISDSYKNFAKEILLVPVPKSFISYHLRMINNANNISISVTNMAKTNEDPIVGLSGLSQYKEYSDDLVSSVSELEAVLSKN